MQLEFNGNTIKANFGMRECSRNRHPGWRLQSFNAGFTADLSIFGLTLTTANINPLVFSYDRSKDQFEMTGGLTLTIPTGDTKQVITASMVDPQTGGPGLIIQNGALKELDISLSGSFSV